MPDRCFIFRPSASFPQIETTSNRPYRSTQTDVPGFGNACWRYMVAWHYGAAGTANFCLPPPAAALHQLLTALIRDCTCALCVWGREGVSTQLLSRHLPCLHAVTSYTWFSSYVGIMLTITTLPGSLQNHYNFTSLPVLVNVNSKFLKSARMSLASRWRRFHTEFWIQL